MIIVITIVLFRGVVKCLAESLEEMTKTIETLAPIKAIGIQTRMLG